MCSYFRSAGGREGAIQPHRPPGPGACHLGPALASCRMRETLSLLTLSGDATLTGHPSPGTPLQPQKRTLLGKA